MWKQSLGSKATYNRLIELFVAAGYEGYADTVRKLIQSMSDEATNISSDEEIYYTPGSPLSPQVPVFPAPAVLVQKNTAAGNRNALFC